MRSSLRRRLLIVFLLGIFLFVSAASAREWYRKEQLRRRIQALEKEVGEVERFNSGLETFLGQLGDEAVIERQARERLNLKKPGEKVVVLVPTGGGQEIEAKTQEQKLPPQFIANVLSWWRYFFSPRHE